MDDGEITTSEGLAELAARARAMIEHERKHPQDNERRVLLIPPKRERRLKRELPWEAEFARRAKLNRERLSATKQAYEPYRAYRPDVLKIMRRMRQRIADGRWSGVPT